MKLTRSSDDRWLGGVAGGIAAFLGIDSTIVRVIFAVLTVIGGSGVLLYMILLVILPRPTGGSIGQDFLERIRTK